MINLNLISQETSRAEHEYMNKHPPINVLATAVAGSSSVDALISLPHSLYADTDGNGKTMRVFLLDFSKAFDRINYKILISKMRKLDINESITNWLIDFLSGRKQRVKISGVFSDWLPVNGSVPQGTVLGSILFLIMVNDLVVDHD